MSDKPASSNPLGPSTSGLFWALDSEEPGKTDGEFARFQELTDKLLTVPKAAVGAKRKSG